MVTRPELDVPIEGLPLLALRLTATVALAHLSYRYIETPVRRGDLGRAWRTLREARGPLRWHLRLQWAGVVLPILASCALLGVAVAQAKPPEKPDYLASMKAVHTVEQSPHSSSISEIDSPSSDESKEDNAKTPEKSARGDGESRDEKKPDKSAESRAKGDKPDKESNDAGAAPGAKAEKTAKDDRDGRRAGVSEYTGSVSAIGDSVMLGAVGRLQKDMQGLTVVDAEVGLQVYTAIDILEARSASGQLGQVVIVHLGNNGTFTRKQFDEIMQILSGVERVVFVNVKVPRAWEEPNNEVIAEGVQKYPNAVLVDWHSASASQPGIFYSDGFHLRPKGQRIYADMISSYLPEE